METTVANTKSFKELVQQHIKDDKKFAEALLREGVNAMLSGDMDAGKTILHDFGYSALHCISSRLNTEGDT